jgi:hypothetical protein
MAMATTKIDMTREHRELYAPGREPVMVEVPEFSFAMIDGHGDPNVASAYREAIEALYSVSYTLKFALKRGPQQLDYRVMPLEGLWWTPDMADFSTKRKADWDWTMMIRQPEEVTQEAFEQAVATAAAKKELPAATALRLERLTEGPAAQLLYVGPYADEGPAIERLHAFIAEQRFRRAGKHHEIYLGDPRRAAPEKLKTIVRQPVTPA